MEEDIQEAPPRAHFLMPDVLFDHMLGTTPRSLTGTYVFPHQRNKSLIRPDQVDKLPHLSGFDKERCRDQVDALYSVLDRFSEFSDLYKQALSDLEHLSQRIVIDIREWRRSNLPAPYLPFSFHINSSVSPKSRAIPSSEGQGIASETPSQAATNA